MDGRLPAFLIAIILMATLLSPVVVSGCAANTRPVGPQEAVGPQESPGSQELAGPQTSFEPQGMSGVSGPMGPQQSGGGPDRIGPADPVVLAARALTLVGLATQED